MTKNRRRIYPPVLARAREFRQPQTPAESKLWESLRDRQLGGFKFRRQHPIDRFIVDFYCAACRLVIEIDGDSHTEQDHKGYDLARTAWLNEQGYHVIRFPNHDVHRRIGAVLEAILVECQKLNLSLSPSPPAPLPGRERGVAPSPRRGEGRGEGQLCTLADLGITIRQIPQLTGKRRSRLLNYLLRWERIEEAHACLDVLVPAHPTLVSLLDVRVKALLVQGRADQSRLDEALAVMEERLQRKTSLAAQALLARVHLARGDVEAARRVARALVEERGDSVTVWALLGEVELACGDKGAALAAYRRLNDLSPQSRAYLLGMVDLYRSYDDWVTASGYAVRLLRVADEDSPLPISYLQRLRDYFRASGEETRVVEIETELARRYAEELADLRDSFAPARHLPSAAVLPAPLAELAPAESLPAFDEVDVSERERVRIVQAARRLFGFEGLLPGQLETIACVLRGEDVLTILPTGGGKSLCYQLPALMAERGTTLVISPLIALMKDQVDSLPAGLRGRATTINSSLEGDELRRRLEQTAQGANRLVYAAPERLRQPTFLHALRRAGLNRLVIDEAHCVSVWGHDFRPDYLAIGRARQALGSPPLLAMTATAPSRVRRDILGQLGDMRIVAGDVTRPNLQLEVFYARDTDDKLRRLLAFCQTEPGNGVIYAGTRARCEELAALLRARGVVADHYHAGIDNRAGVQDDFMAGRTRVVVATVAFGLGIDKPDIRFVVHFVPPPSLEAYYQEAGRAGRDGLPARCLLMYASSDRGTLTRRLNQDVLPVEFLRAVYAAVKRGLDGVPAGLIALGDLERDLQADGTRVRVALSLLERVGLLRRGPDLPRAAIVCLTAVGQDGILPPELTRFCRAARLRPGQPLTLNLVSAAQEAELPIDDIERLALAWADAGLLDYRPAGRDVVLELLPPPQDAAERIAAQLERYETVQAQRVDEIAAYVQTARCRHGHLNAYLGGRTIEHCTACDNCVEIAPPPDVGLPDEREQLQAILGCVSAAPWSWGRVSLMRILRGDEQAPAKARDHTGFGALAFRSETAVRRMLESLESGGFLRARRLKHGGEVLDLTQAGQTAVQNPAALDDLVSVAEEPPSPRSPKEDEEYLEVDGALLQALRAWRLDQARVRDVPPYVVFHDSHLRAIAARRPITLEALAEVKGVGPKRLEQYGVALVELVRRHLAGGTVEEMGRSD
ncbi:MAG: RecQ family ATP-dependent DNA helicase [Anaerolineae bacterium]|nr:RecQ family ATP-dependent DNA helicase [Anaerolineae bacterium]